MNYIFGQLRAIRADEARDIALDQQTLNAVVTLNDNLATVFEAFKAQAQATQEALERIEGLLTNPPAPPATPRTLLVVVGQPTSR